jgi:hypothetical protein
MGVIDRGDLDVWTFAATAGDRIAVNVEQFLETNDFHPWTRVRDSNGALSLWFRLWFSRRRDRDVVASVAGTYLVFGRQCG